MQITKQKNIIINFDNGVSISNEEKVGESKGFILSFTRNKSLEKGNILITNPGEYEYSEILIKYLHEKSILISAENFKIEYILDPEIFSQSKPGQTNVMIFDDLNSQKYTSKQILEIQKTFEPKAIFINSEVLTDNDLTTEKVNKIKLKSTELDLSVDTKLYLM